MMVGLASGLLFTGSASNYFGFGLLAFAAGTNAVRLTLFETLHLPSREMLFLPLPTRIRLRAQPIMDVALAPAGQALGGLLLLLLFVLQVRVESLSLVAAGCSLLLIFVLLKLRPRHSETLAATLRARESMVLLPDIPNLHELISKITFIQQVELFRGLPAESSTRLATIVQEVTLSQGEELFQQGDIGDCLYLVSEGSIDIIVDGNQVARPGKNACLGEMALIGGFTRSATARVAQDARLLRLWSEDFYQLLATEPAVAIALVQTLVARLRAVSRL
jgi:hypothetical protein